jgi:hypothetical protein
MTANSVFDAIEQRVRDSNGTLKLIFENGAWHGELWIGSIVYFTRGTTPEDNARRILSIYTKVPHESQDQSPQSA